MIGSRTRPVALPDRGPGGVDAARGPAEGPLLRPRRGAGWAPVAPVLVLLAAMSALVLLVPPRGEFPIIDDWLYAQVVQSLVARGELVIPAWTTASLVLQAYWGALWIDVFGFSFTALRASTLALGAAGVFGFYLLLRDLLDVRRALLGALILLFNPLYVFYSYSFMTEVPFVALSIWALVCYCRGLGPLSAAGRPPGDPADTDGSQRISPHLGWLAAGSLFAGAAFLVRQYGGALPLAALGGLLLMAGWRSAARPATLAVVLLPFLPAVFLGMYFAGGRGPGAEEPISATLSFWRQLGTAGWATAIARLAAIASTLGIFCLPFAMAAGAWRRPARLSRLRWAAAAALTAGIGGAAWFLGSHEPSGRAFTVLLFLVPLGLGALAGVLGWMPLRGLRHHRIVGLALLGLLAVGYLVRGGTVLFPHLSHTLSARGFMGVGVGGTLPSGILLPTSVIELVTVAAMLGGGLLVSFLAATSMRQVVRGPQIVPLLFGLLTLGLIVGYYMTFDRYLLAILPSMLLLLLLNLRFSPARTWLSALGLVVLAAWSVWWQGDYMARRTAVWQTGQQVVALGVPPEQIDGGYEWNGWYRGQATIAGLLQQRTASDSEMQFTYQLENSLYGLRTPVYLSFNPPPADETVLVENTYGHGQRVFGIHRP